MAITINGTGSITGLTAGGLPDGSIVEADLASSVKLGKVLNAVVDYGPNSATNITSTSFVDTGLEATITPSSTSSKILVTVCFCPYIGGTGQARFEGQIVRDSTQIFYADPIAFRESSGQYKAAYGSMQVLDSPSTTSSVTYKFQALQQSGTDELVMSFSGWTNGPSITLLEIAS